MKRSLPALLVVAAVLSPSKSEAQECRSPSGRQIRVSGSAVVRLPPDRVSFSVGVETVHANVTQAFRANAEKVEAVLKALREKGVQPKELQTSGLEISSRNPDGTPVRGYRVANRVSVTRESASGVGELIEAAVAAGANEASQLSFFVADPGTAQGRGLELAFAAARTKAETLAKLAQQPLGDAVCLTEQSGVPAPMFNVMRGGGSVPEMIEPGTEAITFSVDVVFALGEPGSSR